MNTLSKYAAYGRCGRKKFDYPFPREGGVANSLAVFTAYARKRVNTGSCRACLCSRFAILRAKRTPPMPKRRRFSVSIRMLGVGWRDERP